MSDSLPPPYYPVEVTDLELAFPAHALKLMPRMQDIGEVNPEWEALAHDMFSEQLIDLGVLPSPFIADWAVDVMHVSTVEGIDPYLEMAWRHLRVILGSYEPKHQHKIASLAYLLELWFRWAQWTAGGQPKTAGSEQL